MLLIMGPLLFITYCLEEDNILVSSEGIQPLGAIMFANDGSEIHSQSMILNESDGYTSTYPTKALGHVDQFRDLYLRNYKLEDQTINVNQNYNITHISEEAFELTKDVVVSEFTVHFRDNLSPFVFLLILACCQICASPKPLLYKFSDRTNMLAIYTWYEMVNVW